MASEGRSTPAQPVLLADVGGTNVRFALLTGGVIGPVARVAVVDYSGIVDAMSGFIERNCGTRPIASAVLGVAGQVENGRCEMTNSKWLIDTAQLRNRFDLDAVRVLNDFEALARGLPRLAADDVFALDGTTVPADAPKLVLGPGTGFGAATLMPTAQGDVVIASEAGHATLPAASEFEDSVIAEVRRRLGHVSIERALSGEGLRNLYHAIAAVRRVSVPDRDPAAITEAGLAGHCPTSRAALDLFCAMLGTVAGDLALTFRARGGVFIAGGIVPRFAGFLARSEFRSRFEAKGRYRPYLASVPARVIVRPDATFLGLMAWAESGQLAP